MLKRIFDVIWGLFIIMFGVLMISLYVGLRAKADNGFIALLMILFLIGLGAGAIGLGCWRVYASFRQTAAKQ